MAGKVENKKLEEDKNENYYLLCDRTSSSFLIIVLISRTKITRSHGPITVNVNVFNAGVSSRVLSYTRKEKLIYQTIAALITSNAGHLE